MVKPNIEVVNAGRSGLVFAVVLDSVLAIASAFKGETKARMLSQPYTGNS